MFIEKLCIENRLFALDYTPIRPTVPYPHFTPQYSTTYPSYLCRKNLLLHNVNVNKWTEAATQQRIFCVENIAFAIKWWLIAYFTPFGDHKWNFYETLKDLIDADMMINYTSNKSRFIRCLRDCDKVSLIVL